MYFIINIATTSIIMNIARGFLPSQIKGVMIVFIILPYFGYFPPRMSMQNVTKVKERPVTAVVKKTKLIDHNFLFKGIIKVKGYTNAPKINEVIIHKLNILLVLALLSIMMRQK